MPDTCIEDSCRKDVYIKKRRLCRAHYLQWWKANGGSLRETWANVDITCAQCGSTAVARSCARKYCSRRCAKLAAEGRGTAKTCNEAECDRPHAARGMCRMHYKRWARAHGMERPPSDGWGDRRRDNYHRRRASMDGARNSDRAMISDIIKRDGLTCTWCTQLIDLGLAWPDTMSKSIDHIVPISRGGEHTLSNTRLLHLGCNSSRGNRVDPTVDTLTQAPHPTPMQ